MLNARHPLVAGLLLLAGAAHANGQFREAPKMGLTGGGKIAFADVNNDGWVDAYNGQVHLNDQGRSFKPLEDGVKGGAGVWGDCDNDGRVDLFLYSGKGALHRNVDGKRFQQVPFPASPTTTSRGAVWLDIDNDGLLDLFVGGYEVWQQTVHPDATFRNQGDGAFVQHWQSPDNAKYSARGVASGDLDEDGYVDVFVSNYRLQPNHLWRNDRQGAFAEIAGDAKAAGIADGGLITYTGGVQYRIHGHTIGSAIGDLDDDGRLDILVGNFSHPPADQDRPQFLQNTFAEGKLTFVDRSGQAGLAWQESFASVAFGDYDNDGDLDVFFTTVYAVGSGGIKNFPVLYRNDGNWKFTDVTAEQKLSGLGATYQAAWADVDNDGDLDLAAAGKLFINESPKQHWIELTLEGDEHVNRSAIGSIARVRLGERTLTRQVEGGTGEGNQNDLRLHFGLGERSDPLDVEIAWPGGTRQVFRGLAVDRHYRLKRQPASQ